jgi:ribonucleoside-diphosphate reductase alpha chain
MGYQDALFLADIRYEESDDFADSLQEFISYYAIKASATLAIERGTYESYKGSKWDRGIFPIDTIALLEEERGIPIEVDRVTRQDWDWLHGYVAEHGMRNSNVMAIAPTATICNVAGLIGPCGEALFSNLYGKENMSGGFTVINEYLVNDLKKEGLWNKEMVDQIKVYNGSIQKIDRIPLRLRMKYKTVWEIDQKRSIDLTALRGKWIDQSQSHNIFFGSNNGNKLAELYMYAWKKGLKTTYYLRTLGASGVEKSTLDAKYGMTQKREVVEEIPALKVCSINDPTCEACQ